MKPKILLGTSNPSKAMSFKKILGDDFDYVSLAEANIDISVEENGRTPLENAIIKASEYGKYFDICLCGDSGLFFNDFPLDDPIQPNTHIRRINNKVLNDEELMNYYSLLAHKNGGRLFGYYIDGYALSINGEVFSYCDMNLCKACGFYIVDEPCAKRHQGWPLDSISINPKTGKYFVDGNDSLAEFAEKEKKVKEFLIEHLDKHLSNINK